MTSKMPYAYIFVVLLAVLVFGYIYVKSASFLVLFKYFVLAAGIITCGVALTFYLEERRVSEFKQYIIIVVTLPLAFAFIYSGLFMQLVGTVLNAFISIAGLIVLYVIGKAFAGDSSQQNTYDYQDEYSHRTRYIDGGGDDGGDGE